ncbi:phage-related integrase [Legionella beliardensis]|uniref:Phage-related integrase n=1 Tax=Legionella beliardensis TaxID=91822 RepID=A0A378I5H2_9GAMM|nr:site-specific integrase [Legionella beliardensis]STX29966.1 phage-related integrase [Legionella beliardensis]
MERHFTDAYIKALKPRSVRYEEFKDGGFGIRVTPKGLKIWIYRYKINGQRHFITLGYYPAMSLSEAKKRFIDLSDMRHGAINPKDHLEEAKQKEQQTIKNLMLNWYKSYIEKHRAQPQQIWQLIKADIIPLLGDKKLETLKTREITQALDKIVDRGAPIHANKVLSTLKQAFNYAVSRGEMMNNPAMSIRSRDIGGLEKARERYLSLDEIKTLWQFLESEEHDTSIQIRSALKIILLTGVRTGEIRVAKWSEFDFENSLWTIPAEHTKTNITMRIHLSEMTKKVLLELQEYSDSDYVITGVDERSPLSDKAMPRAVIRIQSRVGIPHWTAHDLRRTFATQLGEALHIDPVVIEKCLGHKMPKIMATYNKNEMLPQRKEALDRWATFIESILQDNIIPIHTGKSGNNLLYAN